MSFLGDSDAYAPSDAADAPTPCGCRGCPYWSPVATCPGGSHRGPQPDRAPRAEIETIQTSIDGHGGGKPPRTTAKFMLAGSFSPSRHKRDAFQRFERADEDRSSHTFLFA